VGCRVSAKIKRSAKAAAVVVAFGLAALFGARPFVALVEDDKPLDPPAAYADYESEHIAWTEPASTDSDLEYRASRPVERVMRAGSGDTMMDLLLRAGVESSDATQAIEALKEVFNPRSLKAGQPVTVTFDPAPQGLGQGEFQLISLNADPIREVATRRAGRGFEASEAKRPVTREIAHFSGGIKSSLFDAAQTAGVPVPIVMTMIRALSYDVDFQRDIQSGDSFDVMFEGWYDPKGKLVRSGDMLYAAINLSGKPIAMFRFEDSQGIVEYYNEKGESVKKALLKTPVDGAKITSGYGLRHHPILGFTKMHKGVDFGVPTGTPIMAAGDGTVEMAGFNGSYGNYVRLRHGNGFATAYAHMSRIAVHAGRRVSQGQIIGFVGTSGRSTGPHLHYEVMQGSSQVNPVSIKMPTGIKLTGKELDRFRTAKTKLEHLLVTIPPSTVRVAEMATRGGPFTD
jgi:murein DD-endopeptidase MepM/ murein hydrolase activator NlpD